MTENELRLKRTGKKERRRRRKKELDTLLRKAPAKVRLEYEMVKEELHETTMEIGAAGLMSLLARAEDVAEEKREKRDRRS